MDILMFEQQNRVDSLRAKLVPFLSLDTWEVIEEKYRKLDLKWRPDLEPGFGKDKYNRLVMKELEEEQVVGLSERILQLYSSTPALRAIEDALWWVEAGGKKSISDTTRVEIAGLLDGEVMNPKIGPGVWVRENTGVWAEDLDCEQFQYDSQGGLMVEGAGTARVSNHRQLLETAGLQTWPDRRFLKFLEALVDPHVREGEEQQDWVNRFNSKLRADGYLLEREAGQVGHPEFRARPTIPLPRKKIKNLIFASKQASFKPIIGLSDALNNDAVVLQHEGTCLVYDDDISNDGLTWLELVKWWAKVRQLEIDLARSDLGKRLQMSLASEPEKIFFKTFFKTMKEILGDSLPALLPQVYHHYDPRKQKEQAQGKKFQSQRMDFLLLLPQQRRVVIEIDGRQHYSEKSPIPGAEAWVPSPKVYSETASADRELRLSGYDVYRFGGYELCGDSGPQVVENFLKRLFQNAGIPNSRTLENGPA